MYSRLRSWLFRIDAERTHTATLRALQMVGALPPVAAAIRKTSAVSNTKHVNVFGLDFSNRVGLAAGYDKDGLAWRGLATLGFGHIEIGTVTLQPQPGSPRPRLFRLIEDQALINRMGFPSRGADFVAKRLAGPRPPHLIIGVSLGLNRDTPLENAPNEYLKLLQLFSPLANYLALNISSPNTPGLRRLQLRGPLENLLGTLNAQKSKPILVKISPDLTNWELEEAIGIVVDKKIDGVIATNTTTSRPPLHSKQRDEAGGLSGSPLTGPSRHIIASIQKLTKGRLPIVANGGIMGATDARAALDAGASLIQVFTGLIYRGPGLVREILQINQPFGTKS